MQVISCIIILLQICICSYLLFVDSFKFLFVVFSHNVCLVTFCMCLFRVVTSIRTQMQTRLSLLLNAPVVVINF